MTGPTYKSIPDVAVSDTAVTAAWVGFGVLALALFGGLAYAHWWRKKQARDGIYSKYKLPGDLRRRR